MINRRRSNSYPIVVTHHRHPIIENKLPSKWKFEWAEQHWNRSVSRLKGQQVWWSKEGRVSSLAVSLGAGFIKWPSRR